jgi:uncharacterized protein YjiK
MNKKRAVALLAGVAAISAGCRDTSPKSDKELKALGDLRQQQVEMRAAKVDESKPTQLKNATPVAMWIMPPELREISGLVLTPDGRILTHDDEVSKIYAIDPRKGILLKQFTLGSGIRGDFESIAMAGNDIYLLESDGVLYQFQEGEDGAGVPYSVIDLHLKKQCEFESMVYQADSNWLVMPCKNAKDKSLERNLVIYRWKLDGPQSNRLSMITIPFAQLIGSNKWKSLHPSDITIDPASGNFVMITSHEKALIEMTTAGDLVRSEPLPEGHDQPEGIAITKDSILMLSDEATRNPAAITLYRWHPSQKPDSTQ